MRFYSRMLSSDLIEKQLYPFNYSPKLLRISAHFCSSSWAFLFYFCLRIWWELLDAIRKDSPDPHMSCTLHLFHILFFTCCRKVQTLPPCHLNNLLQHFFPHLFHGFALLFPHPISVHSLQQLFPSLFQRRSILTTFSFCCYWHPLPFLTIHT